MDGVSSSSISQLKVTLKQHFISVLSIRGWCCVSFRFCFVSVCFSIGGWKGYNATYCPSLYTTAVCAPVGPQLFVNTRRRCEERKEHRRCGQTEDRQNAEIEALMLHVCPSRPLHVSTQTSPFHRPVLQRCVFVLCVCVCVTPPPVSLLHASFLLIVPCFCLTDAPSSKDACLTAALQIGHAPSIPLPATLEGRQPARSCFIYRHQNSFPLWRLSLLVLCYNRTHHRRTVCFDVTFAHFVEARLQRFTRRE